MGQGNPRTQALSGLSLQAQPIPSSFPGRTGGLPTADCPALPNGAQPDALFLHPPPGVPGFRTAQTWHPLLQLRWGGGEQSLLRHWDLVGNGAAVAPKTLLGYVRQWNLRQVTCKAGYRLTDWFGWGGGRSATCMDISICSMALYSLVQTKVWIVQAMMVVNENCEPH